MTAAVEAGLESIAEGVWTARAPVRIVGMPLTTAMAVLRLDDGSLLVYSPVRTTAQGRAVVEALGRVAHLYVPSLTHHLGIAEWAAAFPAARVHAPAGIRKKRPGLRIDRVLGGAPDPALAGVVEELRVDGFRLEERVLFHRPSKTLCVADLVHNIGRPAHFWTRIYAGLMGFHGRVALSRAIRWLGFSDRRAARASLDRVLAWPFERILVGHGDPITRDPRATLAQAFDWLPRAGRS